MRLLRAAGRCVAGTKWWVGDEGANEHYWYYCDAQW